MIFQQGVDLLARQKELDPLSSTVQGAVKEAYKAAGPAGRPVANALYGTWLGHPLHPALTDIPVGAWTAAFALDTFDAISGSPPIGRCADAAVAIGTVAAVGAALAGLTDAQHPSGETRRVAIVHGIMNITLTLLQTASLVQRARGARGAARLLSALAYGGVLVSGYLGGDLIGEYRMGVNRAAEETVPEGFVPVLPESALPENQLRQVDVQGSPVLLVRRGADIYAMHAICTHMGGPLPQGKLVDGTVQCPWHGSRFALDDGHVVNGPASFPERCLATRVRNGMIEVGPGAGLGRCQHEPVPAPSREAQGMVAEPALH